MIEIFDTSSEEFTAYDLKVYDEKSSELYCTSFIENSLITFLKNS